MKKKINKGVKEKETSKTKLENRYTELKTSMQKLVNHHVHSETWKKYLILSEANKIAKKLYGHSFSIRKLAYDFDMSSTNVYEILSLDKMTPKSKKLLKENKISAAKMAMICSTKSVEFQDEIVDLVIKKQLTVSDIHTIKPRTKEDVVRYKFDKAIKLGFARKEIAFRSFISLLDRLNILLESNIDLYPESKYETVRLQLENVKKNIDKFLEKNK